MTYSWNAWSDAWQSYYRNGADSSPAAGAEVSLLLGSHVKQDEHISCYKNQSIFIQRLQVPPASTVVTKGVAESRTQKGPILEQIDTKTTQFQQVKGVHSLKTVDSAIPSFNLCIWWWLIRGIITRRIVRIMCEIPEVEEVFWDFRIRCDKWFGVKLLIAVVHVCRELLLWLLFYLLCHWLRITFLSVDTQHTTFTFAVRFRNI